MQRYSFFPFRFPYSVFLVNDFENLGSISDFPYPIASENLGSGKIPIKQIKVDRLSPSSFQYAIKAETREVRAEVLLYSSFDSNKWKLTFVSSKVEIKSTKPTEKESRSLKK